MCLSGGGGIFFLSASFNVNSLFSNHEKIYTHALLIDTLYCFYREEFRKMTRSKRTTWMAVAAVDEDKAKLKSIWHSMKKFFLRYVLLVIFLLKSTSSDTSALFIHFQMIFLIAVLFLVVEALHMFQRNDEKFYYLKKIIGVGLTAT